MFIISQLEAEVLSFIGLRKQFKFKVKDIKMPDGSIGFKSVNVADK